jgi:mannose-1-phosphate guanylyltransferase
VNIILLSGGSGTRLWPLSNEARSKQFLRLIQDEQGNIQSMAQRVFGQVQDSGLNPKTVTVATSEAQAEAIRSQLGPQVDIVTEPERRNTYPAIALACAYLFYEKGAGPEEPVVVLPVDPYAEIGYFHTLRDLADAVAADACQLALMGVKPTYPSAKYGYILPESASAPAANTGGPAASANGPATNTGAPAAGANASAPGGKTRVKVAGFIEKPDEAEAQRLIQAGALWNCGVFAFKLKYMLGKIQAATPIGSFSALRARYGELTKNSFDYVVAEKEPSLAMIPYEGFWKDLGTWNTFTEHMGQKILGRVFMDETCENTHVVNELDTPVIVMGVKDVVVAASYDGILITDKDQSANIKPHVERIQQRPMYEERRWGEYRVVDYLTYDNGQKALTKRLRIRAGQSISYQIHHHRTEVWTVISGEGEFIQDDRRRKVKAGDVLQIPIGSKHGLKAATDLEFIEVQLGEALEEADVVRLAMEW